jgi:hypothetical protein
LSGADFWQQADRQRQGPPDFMPQQQQRFGAGFADELFSAATRSTGYPDDPQQHDSPPLSPIAIRQVMNSRIGRPKETTPRPPKSFSARDAANHK